WVPCSLTDPTRSVERKFVRLLHNSFNLKIFYFFFQAEDGIRDFHVTGVQTCALPISPLHEGRLDRISARQRAVRALEVETGRARSEEHTSELQSRENLVCRLLLEKKKKKKRVPRDATIKMCVL